MSRPGVGQVSDLPVSGVSDSQLLFATMKTFENDRVQYAGAIYHVMSRGDRREDIYPDNADRQQFLKTLADACKKTAGGIHAYYLYAQPLSSGGGNAAKLNCKF